jgi:dihydrolipoamide dehydrogenase
MSENNFDVIVIGAGPGGYVCAIRAAQLGLKTAIVDKAWMGGVCLNVGCIPSKSLLKNAELAYTLRMRADEFGISFDHLQLDFGVAVRRSRKVAERLRKGVESLMKKNDIRVFMGMAVLENRNTVSVTYDEGEQDQIQAKHIVVATGARAMLFPGWDVDGKHVLTYWEAILQEDLPESVVIIGGGAIGTEFATLWSSFGSKVTIVEMMPRLLPPEDEEIGKELEKAFRRKRINIMTETRVETIQISEHGVRVEVSESGKTSVLEAEQALIASGFRPNSTGLGLESLGVQLNNRGYVEIDDRMATNIPGIWGIGDVTGKLLLAHVASAQGVVCAENIAIAEGKDVHTVKLDYRMMPRVTYTHPEVASFGYTEKQGIEAGYDVHAVRFPFLANGKALGLGESNGFAKIVSDVSTGEILGAHLVGPNVSELLPELTLARKMGASVDDLARNIHAHPTLGEVIMEATQIYAFE